jgi:hypothetical protein
MKRLAAPEALKSIVGPGADMRKSREAFSDVVCSGTTRWNAYISTSSCCHGTSWLPAENFNPARFQIGPSGE